MKRQHSNFGNSSKTLCNFFTIYLQMINVYVYHLTSLILLSYMQSENSITYSTFVSDELLHWENANSSYTTFIEQHFIWPHICLTEPEFLGSRFYVSSSDFEPYPLA